MHLYSLVLILYLITHCSQTTELHTEFKQETYCQELDLAMTLTTLCKFGQVPIDNHVVQLDSVSMQENTKILPKHSQLAI